MYTEVRHRVDRVRSARQVDQAGADPGQPQGMDPARPDPGMRQQPVLWTLPVFWVEPGRSREEPMQFRVG